MILDKLLNFCKATVSYVKKIIVIYFTGTNEK